MVCRDTTHARKPKTVNFKDNGRLPKAITLQLLVKAAEEEYGSLDNITAVLVQI